MKIQTQLIYCLLLLFLNTSLKAQGEVEKINLGNVLTLDITFGGHMPLADMKDRFGLNMDIGAGIEYMTEESNWIFGLRGGYLFGNEVKEDVLVHLRTPEGFVIGANGQWANSELQQRAVYTNLEAGKLIGLFDNNARSGLRLTLGLGWLQHKIRVQEDQDAATPQTRDDYKKGYDRLSNGIAVTEFIGYQHLSNNRLINFFIGVEMVQAFTQSRRDFDFALGAKDETKRTDLLMGLKFGWILPFYLDPKSTENIRY